VTAFHWETQFELGIPEVDAQHRHLVDLLSELSARLETEGDAGAGVHALLRQKVVDYSIWHFRYEERLMAEASLDERHVGRHRREHAEFERQAAPMVASDPADEAAQRRVLQFLVHWLTYHILGADHAMAAQIAAVRRGRSPAEAYADAERAVDAGTATLLRSVGAAFELLSDRNRELTALAASLERRVAARTEALTTANANLEQAMARLETMAMTDALTGLPNRRHALDALRRAWAVSVRHERPLACLLVDADGFKQVNDEHGHEAGDRVLEALAAELRSAVRAGDDVSRLGGDVARLGGDEFLVIAPDTSLEGGLALGERLRAAVATLRVPAGSGVWNGSVSVGVAARTPETEDVEALMRAADRAVYEAKRAGRNAVRAAPTRSAERGAAGA
jgi:hemerythrin